MTIKIAGEQADFKLFLSVWNKTQGQSTPGLHFCLADWLEMHWRRGNTRLLLQAFRSSGKSTITGLFAAWLLYRQPDLRILVLAADQPLAQKMVRNVRRIIERHPLTRNLRPEQADQWAADRFTINRTLELRDPSMLARGIGANLTGSRADIVICDDVEVPNTCDSAEKRGDLRERLVEAEFVLVPGGTLLYLGTPHSWYTIYAELPRIEIGEEQAFLRGFTRLHVPVVNDAGESAWPERFSDADIERMRVSAGPNKFSSQMLLQPMSIADGRLDPASLVFYDDEIQKSDEMRGLYLRGRRLISCSAWWDPAFGKAGGDASVLAIVYSDEDGGKYLHHLAYLKNPPAGNEMPEADFQSIQVAELAREFHLPKILIETNGIGKFLPAFLRKELSARNAPCIVQEMISSRAKSTRILEAFDALLAARALNVHGSIRQTPFIAEMQEWQPNGRSTRDDGLDAAAGALAHEPVGLRFDRFFGRQNWTGRGGVLAAKTDFEV